MWTVLKLVQASIDKLRLLQAPNLRRSYVEPTAQCWSNRGEVFVGCKGGQLFRVDGDSGQTTLIFEPNSSGKFHMFSTFEIYF